MSPGVFCIAADDDDEEEVEVEVEVEVEDMTGRGCRVLS